MHWPTYIANAEVSEPVASGEGLSEERDEEVSEERSDGVRPPKGRPEQADRPRARIAAEAPRARAGRIAWDSLMRWDRGPREAKPLSCDDAGPGWCPSPCCCHYNNSNTAR